MPRRAGGTNNISIHALREEGDDVAENIGHDVVISIHALREEGDCRHRGCRRHLPNFYPRPPRGGRLPPSWMSQTFA